MRVGITYDLRDEYLRLGYGQEETAEFDSPETIDAIENALAGLGHDPERIGNIHGLLGRAASGDRWDLVFNIAEGLDCFGREAQVPAVLDALNIPYTFSDPLVMALTLHKGMTKHVIRDMGIPTPDFRVIEHPSDIDRPLPPFPLFVKPVAGGSSIGISAASKVEDRQTLEVACRSVSETFNQPALVEAFLPGRELTIGIAGTGSRARVLGAMEVLPLEGAEPDAYSYLNKAHYETRVRYRLVEDAVAADAMALAIRVWNGLGCRDAGRVDFRCDASGKAQFVEINPLAGLRPVHSDLVILCRLAGIDYAALIEMIMASACERVTGQPSSRRGILRQALQ
jgi:D-alanine-D-alanine ligase